MQPNFEQKFDFMKKEVETSNLKKSLLFCALLCNLFFIGFVLIPQVENSQKDALQLIKDSKSNKTVPDAAPTFVVNIMENSFEALSQKR